MLADPAIRYARQLLTPDRLDQRVGPLVRTFYRVVRGPRQILELFYKDQYVSDIRYFFLLKCER